MTKKKPSPQNRIWEKERRERLNKTFEDLQRLLPDHEPASTLSKVEILQRAIELISKLQKKIKVLVEECNDPLKEHVKEQEQRLKRLLVRNEELAGLLRKAKINVPPCKYTITEDEIQQQNEEKENGNRERKPTPKQRRAGTAPKKQPVIDKQHPASVASSESLELSVVKCTPSKASAPNGTGSSCSSCNSLTTSTGPPTLRHSNGNGVNVTPALHPTPIMTTSVIISNNGNLVQVPIVAPPSSLLIVGNEDVRSKINLKNRSPDASSARYRSKRGKFTIKSIDLIPGRIVNGKIPIPPLRRSTIDTMKASKAPRLKRKRLIEKCKRLRKSSTPTINTSLAKRARLHEIGKTPNEALAKDSEPHQKQIEQVLETPPQQPCPLAPAINKSPSKEQQKNAQTVVNAEPTRETHLDISLNQTELPEDIFANLHVGPDGSNVHGNNEDGTLSPTAAYLMSFPIVAGGGKAAGNHADTGEGDECHESAPIEHQPSKSNIASANEQTNGMMLDNFSSYFNYGHIDTMGVGSAPTVGHDVSTLHSIPALPSSVSAATTTTSSSLGTIAGASMKEGSFTNYPTIYQSIDNMLDNRPTAINRPTTVASTNRSLSTDTEFPGSVTFTFTLTSNTCTAPTTAQPAIGSAHFYGSSCGALNPVKAVDEFSSPLKPSIEFTFSLTSTTASQPRTVQSQYTNSTMLATTMTTPSYETYGYFHKNVSKPSNYCASFNVLDPLLATEKPATSFTFSLTSSTKTEPAYAQSTIVTVSSTNTTQTYGTPPKLSTKQYHQPAVESFQPKQTSAPKPDKVSQRVNKGNGAQSSLANEMHHPQQQQHLNQSQQQPAPQHQTQSKYDVSWMAAGVHNGQSTVASHSNQQQHQQQSSYEAVPSIEFPTTVGYTGTSNYKSDIFFAHPPGEEHNLTWSSPSKLSNILNDSSSPYFPPVTLPTLNGDLALNTSGGVNSFGGVNAATSNKPTAVGSCKVATNHVKKSYTHSSTVGTVQNEATSSGSFLSVSQLVNEPSKSYPSNTNNNVADMSASSNSGVCQQKPINNNYSAEALIGNSYTTHSSYSSVGLENGRKDKMFDYSTTNTLDNAPSTAGPLILNFDTFGNSSGMDYNKGYNFGNQQTGYISTSYGEAGYNGSGNCGVSNSATASSIPYYGKASVSQAYYNQTNSDGSILETGSSSTNYANASHPQAIGTGGTLGQDYAPYYLPSFGEKKHYSTSTHGGSSEQTSSKSKKGHKSSTVASGVDYVGQTTATSTMAPTTMNSSTSSYSYTSLGNVSNDAIIGSSGSLDHSAPQMDASSYPNYHHHHRHNYHQQQQQQRLPNQQSGNATSDSYSITSSRTVNRKPSVPSTTTASSYSYTQYSSDKTHQPASHHDTHQQSSYSTSFVGSHHPHHLNLSSCINPSQAVSYASVHSTQSAYGQTSSAHQGHYYRQSHHQQQHQQLPGMSTSINSVVPVPNSSSTSSSTITNFNLSTICPEINDKTGRTRDGRSAVTSVPGTAAASTGIPSSVPSIIAHW
uniref:BHLH domain-containing protein n=1 Tax=Anopheles minimus TaxID=112268 RepID=A0A182W9C9_9DIPT